MPRGETHLAASIGTVTGILCGLAVAASPALRFYSTLGPALAIGLFAVVAVGTVAAGALAGGFAGAVIGAGVSSTSDVSRSPSR